jgi:predicted glycosyltransferase
LKRKKTIFIAILNWGLGHATRSVPVINYLTHQGCEVHIGSSGHSLLWLKSRFPNHTFHELPDYHIQYSKNRSQAWAIWSQFGRIKKTIAREHELLKALCNTHSFDVILSDNCYGCYHPDIDSYIITHQLHLIPPKALLFLGGLTDVVIGNYLKPFKEVWIPDAEGPESLSGKLSHPVKHDIRYRYCGIISRFTTYTERPINHDVLAILSGPEPHRTLLETTLTNQLCSQPKIRSVIVRGTTQQQDTFRKHPNMKIIDLAGESELKELIESSEIIISRSGYSTLMDLQHSDKKVVFIPTPGQSEQQYLSHLLSKQGHYCVDKLANFNLTSAMQQAKTFSAGFTVNESLYNVLADIL